MLLHMSFPILNLSSSIYWESEEEASAEEDVSAEDLSSEDELSAEEETELTEEDEAAVVSFLQPANENTDAAISIAEIICLTFFFM